MIDGAQAGTLVEDWKLISGAWRVKWPLLSGKTSSHAGQALAERRVGGRVGTPG